MADNLGHAEVKNRKKKRKTKHKNNEETTEEDTETSLNNTNDMQVSVKEEQDEVKQKTSIESKRPVAAKTGISHKWTDEERERLLKLLKKYASQDKNKNLVYNRVEWTGIEMEGISPEELNEEYKRLIKKVRKIRRLLEVVDDAIQIRASVASVKTSREKPPTNPGSSFLMFCKSKRPSLVAKHPELKFSEVHKKLCEKWRDMPDNKRGKYVKKAEKARIRYIEEMQKYEERQRANIKKPLSAFELWKVERIEDGLEEDEDEEDLQEEWEKLPKSMKKGWLQAATSEKERYKSEINSLPKMKFPKKKATEKDTSTSDEAHVKHEKKKTTSESSDEENRSLSKKQSTQKRKLDDFAETENSPSKKLSTHQKSTFYTAKESSSSDED